MSEHAQIMESVLRLPGVILAQLEPHDLVTESQETIAALVAFADEQQPEGK